MSQEVEKILQSTPFNTYDDLFWAVFNNKARINLSNNACRQIAGTQRPIFANWGIHFGLIPSIMLTIIASINLSNYFLLFWIILQLTFSFATYLLKNLRIKTWFVAAIILVISLALIEIPFFVPVFILALSWLFCCGSVSWWQKKVYVTSIKILRYDKEAFVWAYNSHNLLIEDCYGNGYSKLRQTELERKAYDRLLKILEIGAGTSDVDDAITKFSSFYRKKGIAIPYKLFENVTQLSKDEKCKNLLEILELGMSVVGIENITDKLVDFYQEKGISFPDDVKKQ